MADPRLVTFIQSSLSRNIPLDQIKKSLIVKGWQEAAINEAIAAASSQPSLQQPQQLQNSKPQPKNLSSKKLFIIVGSAVFLLIVGLVLYSVLLHPGSLSDSQFLEGTSVDLGAGQNLKFNYNTESHTITANSITANSVNLLIQSDPVNADLNLGETKKFDLDANGFYDLSIKLNSITNQKANLFVQQINEKICTENWNCTDWSACVNSTQSRTCQELNDCGTESSKPSESQICSIPSCSAQNGTICTENETCSGNTVNSSNGNCCIGTCGAELAFIDCGTDINCLINASGACNPSNLTYSFDSNNSTWTQNNTYYYEIEGTEDEKCKFYQRVSDVSGNFTSDEWTNLNSSGNTTQEISQMVQLINDNLSDTIGNTGTCKLSVYNLEDYITRIRDESNSTLSTSEISSYECTGNLFS